MWKVKLFPPASATSLTHWRMWDKGIKDQLPIALDGWLRRVDSAHHGGVRDHHVAVHEDTWDGLVDTREDGRAHGDVGNEVASSLRG